MVFETHLSAKVAGTERSESEGKDEHRLHDRGLMEGFMMSPEGTTCVDWLIGNNTSSQGITY